MMTMPQRPRGGTTRPPIELGASGAHLRLYPGTDLWVDVPRAVALHLFALVCRANVAKGRSWDRFWRGLTQIERSMTVLFVQANGQWEVALPPEAMLGTTIWLSGLAEDFRAVAAGRCRPPLATDVEQEFETLYAVYVRATVSPDRLQAAWAAQFPKIHALLDRTGVLQILMTDGRANVARDGQTGRAAGEADALAVAPLLRATALPILLVDTAPRPQPFAKQLADAMGGRYVPLPQADAAGLSSVVGAAVRAA